jgi:hypothetical protein
MKNLSLREWDSDSQNTYFFKIATKLTDLGSPVGTKDLIGFYMNCNRPDISDSYILQIAYRTTTGDTWKNIYVLNSPANTTGFTFHKKIFASPIPNIRKVQLRINGSIIGNSSINDFGLIYKKHRTMSTSTHDG